MTRKRPRKRKVVDPLKDSSLLEVAYYIESNMTTPTKLDSRIRSFCKELSPSNHPVFLICHPRPWSRVNYCNFNVDKVKELEGGETVLGYRIWYVENLYIEAERHAVWKRSDGELEDVSFSSDGEESKLFLEDPEMKSIYTKTLLRPRKGFHPKVDVIVRHKDSDD